MVSLSYVMDVMMSSITQDQLKVGDKVHYQPAHYGKDRWENGIVKEIPDHTTTAVRVVYNCADDWHNYQNYTSAMTDLRDLKLGWRQYFEWKDLCFAMDHPAIGKKAGDPTGTLISPDGHWIIEFYSEDLHRLLPYTDEMSRKTNYFSVTGTLEELKNYDLTSFYKNL